MAKIKISALAEELHLEAKELLKYFKELGVESAKISTSSVEDTDADKARSHFGATKKNTEASQNTETETKLKKTSVEKSASAPAEKTGSTSRDTVKKEIKNENENAASGAENAEKAPVKKKKKIIFISNPGNSKMGGFKGAGTGSSAGAPARGPVRSGGRSGFSESQNAYHPIKPLTVPSQPDSYQAEQKRLSPKTPVKKPVVEKPEARRPISESIDAVTAENAATSAQASNASENAVSAPASPKADRVTQNTNRVSRPQVSQRPAKPGSMAKPAVPSDKSPASAQAAEARSEKAGKSGKHAQGDKRNDKSYADKNSEKKAESEKKRQAQEKERRNKNFSNYDENGEVMTRQKRVGRFNRPEVKPQEEEEQIKVINVPDKITIKDLADKMRIQPSAIIKKLFLSGQIMTVNSELAYEDAENIAADYDILCEKEIPVDVIEELLKETEEDPSTMEKRPPVVVVMGHVDHGKTSLLDKIRQSNVIDREAGGITQRIGAYSVKINDQTITFLDTPGHEAFTQMRMRGAKSTDIAVLVIAADDGVKPQTIEAINHAKAAGVEIIVAVNKIDKEAANIDKVKQELTEFDLVSTDWGGTTEFVPVSAKRGDGIDTLLETILLTADILELKANPNRLARGLVLEAQLDKGRGPVANVLIQKGTLHVGDFISAGACSGKVRAMVDDKGKRVQKATPSTPVEILGLNDVPGAGEILVGHQNDKLAKQYAATYKQQHKKELLDETKSRMSLDDLYSRIEEGKLKELNLILKADVQGSVEALKASLLKLSGEEVIVRIIHAGVGAINESDVTLAATSSAIIIGFDVKPDAQAKSLAEAEGVEIKLYNVIYQAIDEVEAAMKGMLAPVYEEKITGHAEIRQIFKASAIGNIAGSYITDGNIQRGSKVRISRDGEQIFEGDLKSLKRFKDDVKEVKEGFECGLVFDGFDQMNVGDTVEAYIMVEVPRT